MRSQITQGEKVSWYIADCGVSPATHTVTVLFRGDGLGQDVTATDDGGRFLCTLTAAQTTDMAAETRYLWQAWAEKIGDATDKRMFASGEVFIKRGLSGTTDDAMDIRSMAEKTLAMIDAALLGSAASDVLEYEIETPAGRRRLKKMSRTELKTFREYFATKVAQERARERMRKTGKFGRQIGVRMRDR